MSLSLLHFLRSQWWQDQAVKKGEWHLCSALVIGSFKKPKLKMAPG